MYIHIGNEFLLKDEDIVGIFDIDGEFTPDITKEFLKNAEKNKITEVTEIDIPRSFVVTNSKTEEKVVLSHISSSAIFLRANDEKTKISKKRKIKK